MINKWELIATHWSDFSPKAKKKWSALTEADLAQISGSRNTLASMIQRHYFVTKKTAHDQIEVWVDKLKM